jgi:amino acid transporter
MQINAPKGFSSLGNGAMLLMAGIPAIMFSVDGFYTVTTLRNKMEKPKKMSSVIVIGLSIVTVIYI